VFSVGLVVGGSIVIPHLRRGVDFLDQMRAEEPAASTEKKADSDHCVQHG
jgi:hypothetical protein